MSAHDLPAALTVGEIAKRLNVPIHRIEYLIRSRNIQPASRAGNNRVFSESDLQYMASMFKRLSRQQEGI